MQQTKPLNRGNGQSLFLECVLMLSCAMSCQWRTMYWQEPDDRLHTVIWGLLTDVQPQIAIL